MPWREYDGKEHSNTSKGLLRDLFAIFLLTGCAAGPGKGRRFAGLADMKPGYGLLHV